jgi:hypothetical protein
MSTAGSSSTGRSVGAVLAGFFATALLSVAVDGILHATGVFPAWGQGMSNGLFVLATSYRVAFTVFGGYVTARLAPARPMKHVVILGGIGFVMASIGAIATWNSGPELGPKWYPLALVVTALPCVWAGGKLEGLRAGRTGTSAAAGHVQVP